MKKRLRSQKTNVIAMRARRINPSLQLRDYAPAPNWLLEREELSLEAKCTYSQILKYFLKGNSCPTKTQLAEDLGTSTDIIDSSIKELVIYQLIKVENLGLELPEKYYLLFHIWMEPSYTSLQ